MLFTVLITGLLANAAVAVEPGTKSLLTVPGLLKAPVLAGGGKLLKREYSVQGQQVVQQLEPNVVLHQEVVQQQQQQQQLHKQQQLQQQQPVLGVVGTQQQAYYGVQQQQPLPAVLVSESQLSAQQPLQQHQAQAGYYGPLPAAVQSRRYVQIVPYLSQGPQHVQPQVIEVDAITAPVQFLFRSASGPLLFQQVHVSSQQPNAVVHQKSEEPAQLLTHEVYKPVVQDLREVIQPFRRITQEIKPVVEEVHTLVAKGDRPTVLAAQLDAAGTLSSSSSSGGEVVQPLASNQQVVSSSSSSSTSTTSQVSGLKTSQVVEQKTETVTDF